MNVDDVRTLWDVPGLQDLRKICSLYDVHFTAFGSLIRNLIRNFVSNGSSGKSTDLFDLVPFSSDIDLVHNGPPGQTDLLLHSLSSEIPFGECFRWQLRSVHDNKLYWNSMKVNNVIPAALMTLSTNSTSGIHDRWNGRNDYTTKSFRYIRNRYYSESPLFRQSRDLEIFSALIYYRVLIEAGVLPDSIESQPGIQEARIVIEEACESEDTRIKLEESAYLRARMHYLTAAIASAAAPGTLQMMLRPLRLDTLRNNLLKNSDFRSLFGDPDTLAVTAHLGGDSFRLPFSTEAWKWNASSVESDLREILKALHQPRERENQQYALGPGQRVLIASPPYKVTPGISLSSHSRSPAERASAILVNEFIHIALRVGTGTVNSLHLTDTDNLAMVLALRLQSDRGLKSIVVPIPSAFWLGGIGPYSAEQRLMIRMNCGGLLEYAPVLKFDPDQTVSMQFFVLQWLGVQS